MDLISEAIHITKDKLGVVTKVQVSPPSMQSWNLLGDEEKAAFKKACVDNGIDFSKIESQMKAMLPSDPKHLRKR